MYVGRIVAVGLTTQSKMTALYRVSSRSFPHREAVISQGKAAIVPKKGYEGDISKNPYIAYNCLRTVNKMAIATNGAQTDPIAEKIESGMNPRDALVTSLFVLDYEKDKYNTPRIAAIADQQKMTGYLGIVRHDALLVKQIELKPGTVSYVCTYEHDEPDPAYADNEFDAENAIEACNYMLGKGVFESMEYPITAASAVADKQGSYQIAAANAETKS